MRKWIAVTAAVACLAAAGAAAAGLKLVNEPPTSDLGPCRTAPAADTQPAYVVAIGTNASDARLVETHMRHLSEVVLPQAAADNARIVIGTISADSEREPRLVADVSLLATGDASDNPENQAMWAEQKTEEILACVRAAASGEAADRSDVFGALAWAANVLPLRAEGRHVVLLSDDINTTAGCNLTGRDISAAGRQLVADECGTPDYRGLDGTDVWLGGVGLSGGGDATAAVTPSTLTEFWTWFVTSHGGHVSRSGATLLPGE